MFRVFQESTLIIDLPQCEPVPDATILPSLSTTFTAIMLTQPF